MTVVKRVRERRERRRERPSATGSFVTTVETHTVSHPQPGLDRLGGAGWGARLRLAAWAKTTWALGQDEAGIPVAQCQSDALSHSNRLEMESHEA